MEEFLIAHHQAVEKKRKNFVVIVLKEQLDMEGLNKEVKLHLQTRTYVDATKNIHQVVKRVR